MVWYWLYGLLVYFGMKPLLFSLCRYFLAAHSLSLGFEYASLCCVKDGTLAWSPVCLVLLFVPVALGDWPKKTLPGFMSENVLSSLFQESCGVLCFKSVRHFELILCVVWGRIPASLIHTQLSSFHTTTCWRDCHFSIIYFCLFYQRLIGHWCGFISECPILFHRSMSVFVPIPCCFDYCSFVVLSKGWEQYTFNFVLFPQGLLWQFCLLWFHINFRIIFSNSVENVISYFIGLALNL